VKRMPVQIKGAIGFHACRAKSSKEPENHCRMQQSHVGVYPQTEEKAFIPSIYDRSSSYVTPHHTTRYAGEFGTSSVKVDLDGLSPMY